MNGRSQATFQVPKPPGYMLGQKSKFAYLDRTRAVPLLYRLLLWSFLRYEGLTTRAYRAIIEL